MTDIEKLYGEMVRIRVCGLCWQGDRLLLVNHRMGSTDFWAPPGGGLEFGQRLDEALMREFSEETGLDVQPGSFKFIAEFVRPPLHAVEVFFDVQISGGNLETGHDPEMAPEDQIIRQVAFLEWGAISTLEPAQKHGILNICRTPEQLKSLSGFHRI